MQVHQDLSPHTQNTAFSAWLNNRFEACYTLWKKMLRLETLGMKALELHGKSEKYSHQVQQQSPFPRDPALISNILGPGFLHIICIFFAVRM